MSQTQFQKTVWAYYAKNKRHMPWRAKPTPYYVLVSELMLQQTQVPRVVSKFEQFIKRFPTLESLAGARLGDVLAAWSGLGYNRRAKYLWQAAKIIQAEHGGEVPKDIATLVKLPGIGPNTAGAIVAYAYNQPVASIETNIRTTFIHSFFQDATSVADADIRPLVEATMPTTKVRDWYYALMDYGAHLKATQGAGLHKVRGYRPQSRFVGSLRQVRGQVIKLLMQGKQSRQQLEQQITDERLPQVLDILIEEGLIHKHGSDYGI